MDESPIFDNENKRSAGNKRQQTESPFSAATPKSRLGREPKRIFGTSSGNMADSNLEETCLEHDSRPSSASSITPADNTSLLDLSTVTALATDDASFVGTNDASITPGSNVDVNLEQSELYDTSNCTSNLSMVQESDETDADATLSNDFDNQLALDGETTPTASRTPMSQILSRECTPTVSNPQLLTEIAKGVDQPTKPVRDVPQSPVLPVKGHIDFSLHEFEMLEQNSEHEESIKLLQSQIELLRQSHSQQLSEIQEARIFEEKMLTQQVDSAMKKAKSDREAAKAREQVLEKQVQELRLKLEEPDEEKNQLVHNLAALNAQIEELTQKALKVDSMQQGATASEDRIRELIGGHQEAIKQLENTKQMNESLQRDLVEKEARFSEEMERIRTESQTTSESLKYEHELVRKMMIEDMEKLEAEVLALKSQQANLEIQEFHDKIKQLELEVQLSSENKEKLQAELMVVQEKASENIKNAEEKVNGLEAEVEKLRFEATNNSRVVELEQQLEEFRSLMIKEISDLENQLEAAKLESGSTSEPNAQLEASQATIQELTSEMKMQLEEVKRQSDENNSLNVHLTSSNEKIAELTSSLEMVAAQLLSSQQETDVAVTKVENLELKMEEAHRMYLLDIELSRVKIDELQSSIEVLSKLEREVQSSNLQNEELKLSLRNFEELQADLAMSKAKNEELEQQIEDSSREFSVITEANKEMQLKLDSSEAQISEMTASLTAFQEEMQSTRADAVASEDKVKELESLLENLKEPLEELNNLRANLKDSNGKVLELQSQLDLAQQFSDLTDRLQEDLRTSDARVQELNVQVSDLQSELETARQDTNAVQVVMEALKSEQGESYEALRAELDAAVQEKGRSSDLVTSLEGKIQELETAIESSTAENVQKSKTIQDFTDKVSLLESQICELKSQNEQMEIDTNLNMDQLSEMSSQLESANAELIELTRTSAETIDKLRGEVEKSTKAMMDQEEHLAELVAKIESRDVENADQAAKHKEEQERLQSVIDTLRTSQSTIEESQAKSEELNSRIKELQASIEFAQKALADTENAKQEKVEELEKVQEQMLNLVQAFEVEKASIRLEWNSSLSNANEKLEAAEEALSQKENTIVTLESRIETISQQFEARLEEANVWKSQAMQLGTLTQSLSQMQRQLGEMHEKMEASDRRVIEVEEQAQHDITLIQVENKEQSEALEQAHSRILELEEKLVRAEIEIQRLEKVCDAFDDDEREYKDKIMTLQSEIKQLKGVKTPPRVMGLIEQARLGVKQLSRESSLVEPQNSAHEDAFEDAQNSFQDRLQTMSNTTARQIDASNHHPEDHVLEKSARETPSKKNRSNCQHQ